MSRRPLHPAGCAGHLRPAAAGRGWRAAPDEGAALTSKRRPLPSLIIRGVELVDRDAFGALALAQPDADVAALGDEFGARPLQRFLKQPDGHVRHALAGFKTAYRANRHAGRFGEFAHAER